MKHYIILLVLFSTSLVFGSETAEKAVNVAPWYVEQIPTFISAIVFLISLFGGVPYIKKLWVSKLGLSPELFEIAKASVIETYTDYVRDIKSAKDDGKLTTEEAAAARSKAGGKIVEKAKNLGIPVAKELIPSLIERAVNWSKKDAKKS